MGEAHLDPEAAVQLGFDADARPVGGGDGVNDREPEAVSVAVAGARGPESLEGLLKVA